MLGSDGEYLAVHPKDKFRQFFVKNCKISAVKQSIEKLISFNFVNLSPTFVENCIENHVKHLRF